MGTKTVSVLFVSLFLLGLISFVCTPSMGNAMADISFPGFGGGGPFTNTCCLTHPRFDSSDISSTVAIVNSSRDVLLLVMSSIVLILYAAVKALPKGASPPIFSKMRSLAWDRMRRPISDLERLFQRGIVHPGLYGEASILG